MEQKRQWYENAMLPSGIVREANQQYLSESEATLQNEYLKNSNLPDRLVPASVQKPKPAWS